MSRRALIAGCGDVGTRLGLRLAARGYEVWGLRRRPERLPAEIRPLAADLTDPSSLRSLPQDLDVVAYTAAASAYDDDSYRAAYVTGLRGLCDALPGPGPRCLAFTSSTGVHAQSNGEWVDETSAAEPVHFSGRRVREGERLLLEGDRSAVVVRLGGIYGPNRTRLLDRVRRGEATVDPDRYTNRIHVEDCAAVLDHVLHLDRPETLYLGVDDEPALASDVAAWIASRVGVSAPCARPDAPPSDGAAGGKRCSNRRLTASGYRFVYPTYREGYAALIASETPAGG